MPPSHVLGRARHTAGRARRIAEPGLLAAIAAVIHLADYFLAMGMIGSIVCPLPHVLNVRRHGMRAGLLGALCTLCLLLIIGGPVEAGFHLFLFVAPGLAAGWALSSERPLIRTLVIGTLVCGLGAAGTYYVLETLMGVPDSMKELGEWAVWAGDHAAWPFRWLVGPDLRHEWIPGLASLASKQRFADAVLALPFGLFLSLGFVVFYTTWFVAAFAVIRLGESAQAPPLPLAPRMPRTLALLFLVSACPLPTGAPPWARIAQANVFLMLALAAYLVGYLNLLVYARTRPGGALLAMLASLYLYYLSIWTGLLSALRSEADDKAWRDHLAAQARAAVGAAPGAPWAALRPPPSSPSR